MTWFVTYCQNKILPTIVIDNLGYDWISWYFKPRTYLWHFALSTGFIAPQQQPTAFFQDPRKASFIVLEDLSLEDFPYVEQLSKETLGPCGILWDCFWRKMEGSSVSDFLNKTPQKGRTPIYCLFKILSILLFYSIFFEVDIHDEKGNNGPAFLGWKQSDKKHLPEKNLCQWVRPAGEDPQLKLAL